MTITIFFLILVFVIWMHPTLFYAIIPPIVCFHLHDTFRTKLQTPNLEDNFVLETIILSSLGPPLIAIFSIFYLAIPLSLLALYNLSTVIAILSVLVYHGTQYIYALWKLVSLFISLPKALYASCSHVANAPKLILPFLPYALRKGFRKVYNAASNLIFAILSSNIFVVLFKLQETDPEWNRVLAASEAIRTWISSDSDMQDFWFTLWFFQPASAHHLKTTIARFFRIYTPPRPPKTPALDAFFADAARFFISLNITDITTNYILPPPVASALSSLQFSLSTLRSPETQKHFIDLLVSNNSLPGLIPNEKPPQNVSIMPIVYISFILLILILLVPFLQSALNTFLPVLISARYGHQPIQDVRATLQITIMTILTWSVVRALPYLLLLSKFRVNLKQLITFFGHLLIPFPVYVAAHIYFARQVARKNILNRQDASLFFAFFRVVLGITLFDVYWYGCGCLRVIFALSLPSFGMWFAVGDYFIYIFVKRWCFRMCDGAVSEEQVFLARRERRVD